MADQPTAASPGGHPHERRLILVVRYFDGDLDEAETVELNALLRGDPECRRLFAGYSTRGCLIRETLDPERQRSELPLAEELASDDARPRRKRGLLLAGAGLLATA